MERTDIIVKIKKMMAVANDPSASDTEIQLATVRASKMMLKYKIQDFELFSDKSYTKDNVEEYVLQGRTIGYFEWILQEVAKSFQCKTSYRGKVNSNNCSFTLYGLKKDIELCVPVAEALLYYIDNMLRDLKECYCGTEDFRVFKRNYMMGFAQGIKEQLASVLNSLQIETKYELAVVTVPAVVEEVFKEKVNVRKGKYNKTDYDGFILGKNHGTQFDLNKNNLLKG